MSDRNKKPAGVGLSASEWLNIFRVSTVEIERLDAAKSAQGRATIIGNFLARMVDREVPIEVDGRTGKATLRSAPGRSRRVHYYFEVAFDDGQSSGDEDADNRPRPTSVRAAPAPSKPPRRESIRPEPSYSPTDRSPATGLMAAKNDEAW